MQKWKYREGSVADAIRTVLRLLDSRDRSKFLVVILIYLSLGIIEILAVLSLGLVGSLAVSGVAGTNRGDRVQYVLEFLSIENKSLQFQTAFLGTLSTLVLIMRSFSSLQLSRRILLFLGRRAAAISKNLVRKFMGQDILAINKMSVQENIYALTSGVEIISIHIVGGTALLVSDVILISALAMTMFAVDISVAIMALIIFSLIGVLLYKQTHLRVRELGLETTKLNIESGEKISEMVLGYREIFVKGRKAFYAELIGKKIEKIGEINASLTVTSLMSKYVLEVGMILGGFLIGAYQFMTQPASRAVAVISVFLVASTRILPAVLRLQNGLISVRTHIATAKPTLDLIKNLIPGENEPENTSIDKFNSSKFVHVNFIPEIKVRNVSFQYPDRNDFKLNKVSLTIGEGQFVGIVGSSGSGKSTIVDTLLGVVMPKQGSIEVSGVSPREALAKWPGAIAYVPQTTVMITGSVKENVCLGFDPDDVPDDLVCNLLRDVELSDILRLEKGIHTFAGHRGSNLSGGQRQRLGIARALITSPKLLILDEATSALDSEVEKRIVEFLGTKRNELTIISVAHRLSAMKVADRIIFVEEGKIIDEGSFKELRVKVERFDRQVRALEI